jgi:hypothetical protein
MQQVASQVYHQDLCPEDPPPGGFSIETPKNLCGDGMLAKLQGVPEHLFEDPNQVLGLWLQILIGLRAFDLLNEPARRGLYVADVEGSAQRNLAPKRLRFWPVFELFVSDSFIAVCAPERLYDQSGFSRSQGVYQSKRLA